MRLWTNALHAFYILMYRYPSTSCIHVVTHSCTSLTNLCRWWPGQVVPMTDIPENIKKKQPGEGMFVVRYVYTHMYAYAKCILLLTPPLILDCAIYPPPPPPPTTTTTTTHTHTPRFCGTHDYCWIHHGRTLSLSLEPGADPAKEVNKMCRSHGRSSANTNKIFKRGE